MNRATYLVLLAVFLAASSLSYAQYETESCANLYGGPWSFTPPNQIDYTEHEVNPITNKPEGSHFVWGQFTGSCTYSGNWINGPNGYCNTACSAVSTTLLGESGPPFTVTIPFYGHQTTGNGNRGYSQATGAETSCGGTYGGATEWCISGIGCGLTVNVSAGANGYGASVTISPPANVWTASTVTEQMSCPAQLSPGCIPGIPPTTNNGSSGMWQWNPYPACAWIWIYFRKTPLLIDTDGSGYHLTSAKDGILWDFYGNGRPIQMSWTERGSTNGWLAIDLDGNGKIDSARELFGDISYHVPPPRGCNEPDCHNGFNSLMYYDSNGDGVIDKKDRDWPKLLVWIDSNHDGVSQPEELHHLDEVGIHSISLKWEKSSKIDEYGNEFRFKGTINPGNTDDAHRDIYDVFLLGQYEFDYERSAKDNICWDKRLQKAAPCDSLSDRSKP
jgi:hypothetical protein